MLFSEMWFKKKTESYMQRLGFVNMTALKTAQNVLLYILYCTYCKI